VKQWKDKSSKGGIPWWSSAWVGLVGTAVGILIAILGIAYTYWSNQRFRQLTYYVYPIRTVVLRREEATGLRVIFRGQDITTDVTAAQLTIWNQGREPIYRSDILREVRLETVPPVKILEATIRKVSRGETGFAIDVSRLAQGMVPVRWTILEHNDGAILQLIYAGSPLTDISVDGSIVGQRSISTIEFRGKILSPSDQLAALERSKRVTGGLAVFSVSIAIVASLLLLGLRG